MTKILRSTDSNNASSASITEAQFQAQAAAQVDALRQLVGNADLVSGSTFTNPLNSPITLYVDPNIGRDDWEGGSYNTNAASRIDNQQLVCGYSPNRPFRTLNRAVIEAAILTSKSYLSATGDLVTIFCAPGVHTLLNGAGDANTDNITNWGTSKADTNDAAWNTLLTRFNDPQWGIILPRGVTICGWDLRKTVIRPASVPSASGKTRRRMLRVTSDCYFFGFSFKDAVGVTTSHHNLACFGFAGQTALDLFYQKIRAAFPNATTSSNLDADKAVTLTKEYQIVGDQPDTAASTSDTVNGSSPYVFNCSLRSAYGLSGIDLDGSLVTGLKSLVTAQFTNVSLQKDMAAFQKYSGGDWVSVADYADYINTDINNIRAKVSDTDDYRHFTLRCSNGAFMQAVSIFAIGNAVHHWCESGGEITLTNSNSNFGYQASLATGFRGQGKSGGAFPQDTNFTAAYIRRPKAIPTDGSNIRKVYLGTVSSISTTSITLTTSLDYVGLLTRNHYSLRENDLVWIENNNNEVLSGADFRAQLGATPWSSGTPTQISVKNNGNSNFGETGVAAAAVGNRVYIRRLVDNRSPEERETSFIVQNTGTHRRPVGSYVIRLDRNGSLDSTAGSNQLDPINGGGEVFLVGDSTKVTQQKNGTALATASYKVIPVSGDSQRTFSTSSDNYYRLSEVVVQGNRYYRCLSAHTATSFDSSLWVPTLSNVPVSASAGGIEAARSNIAPTIILDGDTDTSDTSTTLGWDFTVTGSTVFLNQLRSGADYRALKNLMLKLGYAAGTSSGQVDNILHPTTETSRDYQISTGATPSGGKLGTSRDPWPIEFNRYSVVRAYGLAYEWVGYGNYSKALPKYQVSRLSDQQGLDVLAANVTGGRCFNQGTTEEGLIVTPYVVQDLGTGRSYNTETAGLGGISGDVEYPTTLPNLTVTGTTTTQRLVVNGDIAGAAASTVTPGIGSIARIAELTSAVAATSDADLNSAGPKFVTPRGLVKACDARYSPILTAANKRLYVLPSGSSLPSNAASYPLIEGGTVDLNKVTTYTTIQAAYASLPSQFTLADGDHIDIYLLASTIDLGTVADKAVGSSDPSKRTYIIPFNWGSNNIQQIITYNLSAGYDLADGPFWNCTFYTVNDATVKLGIKGRFNLVATALPVQGGEPRTTVVVGRNIHSTNLLVELKTPSNDTVSRSFLFFKGCRFSPYQYYARQNECPVYLGITFSGGGALCPGGGVDYFYNYPFVVFQAEEGMPVDYGAAMCLSTTLATYTDTDKRLATALFEFTNNKGVDCNILFNHIRPNGKLTVDGASYGSYTTNISWVLQGANKLNWRLFSFEGLAAVLDGSISTNATGLFTGRGTTCQAWGGFFNNSSSSRLKNAAYYPGPYTQFYSELSNWGVFGAGGNVAATNSLLGADGSGYYLRPLAARYALVTPVS